MRSVSARPDDRRFDKSDLLRLGRVLREHRLAAGLSVRRLSAQSGVSVSAIRAVEAGASNPALATVLPLVEALGLGIDTLVEAVRTARSDVVVERAGAPEPTGGAGDLALRFRELSLPGKSVRPPPEDCAERPSLVMVLSGNVIAGLEEGGRAILETGDCYHAEAGAVTSWANPGARESRLFWVAESTRG